MNESPLRYLTLFIPDNLGLELFRLQAHLFYHPKYKILQFTFSQIMKIMLNIHVSV